MRSSSFLSFLFVYLFLFVAQIPLCSQVAGELPDTLRQKAGDTISGHSGVEVLFTETGAIGYLERLYESGNWKDENDPFRLYIGHLIIQVKSAHQSRITEFMKGYPFEKIMVPAEAFIIRDTVRIALPDFKRIDTSDIREVTIIGDYAFSPLETRFLRDVIRSMDSLLRMLDSADLLAAYHDITDSLKVVKEEAVIITDTIAAAIDTLYAIADTVRKVPVVVAVMPDSLIAARDSVLLDFALIAGDTLFAPADTIAGADMLAAEDIQQKRPRLKQLGPNLFLDGDTILLVIEENLKQVFIPDTEFPFLFYDNPQQGDSIEAAISGLVDLLERRDSTVVYFTGLSGEVVPLWLNTMSRSATRFWLPNDFEDSVTIWIGNPYRNTVGLYLENNIQFRRPVRTTTFGETTIRPMPTERRTLGQVQTVFIKPNYWRYHSDLSLMVNQTYLSNWARGGESSISGSIDVIGNANYRNPENNMEFTNSTRLRHGLVYAEEKGVRRNMDFFDLNSKLNFKAFGKFDFSSTAHFRTQLAKGYRYPNDSIPISKFLNPGTFTVGTGLDYKPNRETSINLSPLSYKVTFLTDTANFSQRRYSIDEDRKARHELGATLQASYRFDLFENIRITNRLNLFSNYINKPKNIDIDWEMIIVTSLNWFTDVRINTHLIYDDDIRFTVRDKEGNPVLGEDGKPKERPRIQFREVIGFTLVFRF